MSNTFSWVARNSGLRGHWRHTPSARRGLIDNRISEIAVARRTADAFIHVNRVLEICVVGKSCTRIIPKACPSSNWRAPAQGRLSARLL